MLKIDKNFENFILKNNFEKIKFFFYKGWCAELKLGVEFDNFEINENLENFLNIWKTKIFVEKSDIAKFENAMIIRTIKADHTGVEKVRYIFSDNNAVKRRCWCGTSFSFEPKKVKLDLWNLKNFKEKFAKK